MKRAAIAVALLIASPSPAFGQAQRQTAYKIGSVTERQQAVPQWVESAHHYARAAADTTTPCNDWLIAPAAAGMPVPSSQTAVWLIVGCNIPVGTYLLTEVGADPPQPVVTTKDAPAGSILEWDPPSALATGGSTFTLTIVPTGAAARQLTTSFDTPAAFQAAYEQAATVNGKLTRTIVVQGPNTAGARALFAGVDVTSHLTFATATATTTIDVSTLTVPDGIVYPLTIASGAGTFQTILVFHPNCEKGACGTTPTVSPTVPPSPSIGPYTAVQNPAVKNQAITAGTTNALLGSYIVTATAAGTLPAITFFLNVPNLQNVYLTVNGTPFGKTQTNSALGTIYLTQDKTTFAANATFALNIYGDIPASSSGFFNPGTVLTGLGTLNSQGNIVLNALGVDGQAVTIGATPSAVAPTLYVHGSTPAATVTMGTPGVILDEFYLSNPSTAEGITVNALTVKNATTSAKPGFGNLLLWQDGIPVAVVEPGEAVAGGYQYTILFISPPTVGNQTRSTSPYILTGDVSDAESGAAYSFAVTGANAKGKASGLLSSFNGSDQFSGTVAVR